MLAPKNAWNLLKSVGRKIQFGQTMKDSENRNKAMEAEWEPIHPISVGQNELPTN